MLAARNVHFVDIDIVDRRACDGCIGAGEELLNGLTLAAAEHSSGLATLYSDRHGAQWFDVAYDDLTVFGERVDVIRAGHHSIASSVRYWHQSRNAEAGEWAQESARQEADDGHLPARPSAAVVPWCKLDAEATAHVKIRYLPIRNSWSRIPALKSPSGIRYYTVMERSSRRCRGADYPCRDREHTHLSNRYWSERLPC